MRRVLNPSAIDGALVNDLDIIVLLRQLMPDRALTWSEEHSIAERQATLFLQLMHVDEPPVPQLVICNLPGIRVDWRPDWPTSGMAIHAPTHWQIVVRASEPVWRQRFSLAHELKHVLDDPVIDRLHAHLRVDRRQERAERLCNYFAASLLMPRAWLKRDWCNHLQNVRLLARRYYVSDEAMSIRLSELGLTSMTLAIDPAPSRHREWL